MKKRLLGAIIALVIIGIFVWYIASNWQQFSQLSFVHAWLLLPALVVAGINIYCVGMLMELALRPLGVRLSSQETLGLASLNRFCNLISPGYLGAAIRAMYLKKTYRFSFANFSSSFLASNLVLFLVSGLLALLAFGLSGGSLGGESGNLPIILLVAVVLFTGMLIMPFGPVRQCLEKLRAKRKNKLLERFSAALAGFIKIRHQPLLFYTLALWAALSIGTATLMVWLLYHTLGYPIAFLSALFITAIGNWGVIFSITPANIGIREGLMVIAAHVMQVPIVETLAVSLLMRLVVFVVAAVLSSYYAPKLLHTSLTHIGKFNK